jgi:tetratricopeptide (TPR) repeat protein
MHRLLLIALGSGIGLAPIARGAEPPLEPRTIPVTVVTDDGFRTISNWRGFAQTAIASATAQMTEETGVAFRFSETVDWNPPEGITDLSQALDAAVAAIGPRDGITMVLLGRPPRRLADPDQRGYAYLTRPALVVLLSEIGKPHYGAQLRSRLALMIRHELGHVFGLPHLRHHSVMHPVLEERRDRFQDLELDVLRANRNLDFTASSPFTGSDLEVLRDVYRIWNERGEMQVSLLVNLGVALHREGHPADAREMFALGLDRTESSTVARLGMAQAANAMGDGDLAREMIGPLDPGALDPRSLEILGAVRLQLGETAAAESLLSRALESPSPRFSGWFNRGLARFHLERYAEAGEDFRAALEREERPEGWYNLGLTEDALGNLEASDRAFTRFLEFAPDSILAARARAFLDQHADRR